MKLKTENDIKILREGGHRLATILKKVALRVVPGVSTLELDTYARELILAGGDEPAFLNYKPAGVKIPYPASLCVSIDSEVVHGIPRKNRIVESGDVVTVDLGLKHGGLFTDHAVTVIAGDKQTPESVRLVKATREALEAGIKAIRVGGTVGDIGAAVEAVAKREGLGIVRILSGHGVGFAVHEDPYVPNYGKAGTGEKLVPGMVIAIEPMLTLGTDKVVLERDQYTYTTKDGSLSAHFEHTVAITEKGAEILTK